MSKKEAKDILSVLSGNEALQVLRVLVRKDPLLASVVIQEVKEVLKRPNVIEEVADDVYFAIEILTMEDCWARSGRQRGMYLVPSEAADEMFEEAMERFIMQLMKYREGLFHSLEVEYLKGILLGLYQANNASSIELNELLDDSIDNYADNLISEWKELHPSGDKYTTSLQEFLKESCPDWDSL